MSSIEDLDVLYSLYKVWRSSIGYWGLGDLLSDIEATEAFYRLRRPGVIENLEFGY